MNQIERFQAEYYQQYAERIEFPLTHPCKEWAWFQLGEASGMKLAASEVESLTHPAYMYGEEFSGWDTCIDVVMHVLDKGEI